MEDENEEIPVTTRLSRYLIKEIVEIARRERRSRSKVIAMLLERGVRTYRKDGLLLLPDDPGKRRTANEGAD